MGLLDRIEIKVNDLIKEKSLSNESKQLFEEYISEILRRVDHGGFPMNVPIVDILESLYIYSQGILTHAQVYSQESVKIEKDHINAAIVYLDTRYALGAICADVVREYEKSKKMPLY